MAHPAFKLPATPELVKEKHSFAADFISKIYPVSEHYKEILRSKSYFRTLRKGEIVVQKGELCNFICFIRKGLIRGYINHAGGDITTWISCENELVTSITGFFQNKPAKENIQAIENCLIEVIDTETLAQLYEECPESNVVTRVILEQYYQDAENRAFVARLPTATEKYTYLMESDSYRHLLNRAPLKYIASFLGIRLETLSRMRKKHSALS